MIFRCGPSLDGNGGISDGNCGIVVPNCARTKDADARRRHNTVKPCKMCIRLRMNSNLTKVIASDVRESV